MLELGIWITGFILLLVATWLAGKYHAERNAVRRILERRGLLDNDGPFEEQHQSELQRRIEQASRRLRPAVTKEDPQTSKKLKIVS
ncbi:MAG: hypothetical protein QNI91_08515 [Arenicellales bacterium]|nr:hypothetical protein [Arenicellales bacterium]